MPKKVSAQKQKTKAPAASKKTKPAKESTETVAAVETESPVSKAQIKKALTELEKFHQREKDQAPAPEKASLFDDDEEEDTDLSDRARVVVTVSGKKYFSEKPQFKPKLIKLSHSLRGPTTRTCLILRDNLVTNEEQLQKIEDEKIPTLEKILTLKQIKTEYKQYEQRRALFKAYDFFLVDDAVLNSMSQDLGKIFYGRQNTKIPIAIRTRERKLTDDSWISFLKQKVERVLATLQYLPPMSNNVDLTAGTFTGSKFTIDQLVDNVHDIVKFFDIATVKSIHVKLPDSPALPLYYTEKLYSEADVVGNSGAYITDDAEAAFEQGLLELADETTVAKALGKELHSAKNSSKAKAARKAHHEDKPVKNV